MSRAIWSNSAAKLFHEVGTDLWLPFALYAMRKGMPNEYHLVAQDRFADVIVVVQPGLPNPMTQCRMLAALSRRGKQDMGIAARREARAGLSARRIVRGARTHCQVADNLA